MNAFNVLAKMFVYENPSDIENVENAFELATEKLAENVRNHIWFVVLNLIGEGLDFVDFFCLFLRIKIAISFT